MSDAVELPIGPSGYRWRKMPDGAFELFAEGEWRRMPDAHESIGEWFEWSYFCNRWFWT